MPKTNVNQSEREKRNAARAYAAATQSMVLLKNENHVLPIAKNGKIALLGQGAVRTVRGGTGSGDPFNGGLSGGGRNDIDQSPRYNIHILDAFVNDGYEIPNAAALYAYAEGYDKAKNIKSENPMETFAYPEMTLDEMNLQTLAQECEAVIYVLSRNAGEGADRHMMKKVKINGVEQEVGDYLLNEVEIENLTKIKKIFAKTILVLNVGGNMDLNTVMDIGIDAILLMGQCGQEGGRAVRDVLNGTVNPSGKLTSTWAKQYADYPASKTFALNDGNAALEKYEEGMYVGYRYFDGFNIDPLYAFGYGLSYTDFSISFEKADIHNAVLHMEVSVTNTGSCTGKEVVQVYFQAPQSELEMPVQELIAFTKTDALKPGETQHLSLAVPVVSMASFDTQRAAYILSAGDFSVYIGNSSRHTTAAFIMHVPETIVTERVRIEYPLNTEMTEISRKNTHAYSLAPAQGCPVVVLNPSEITTIDSRSPFHDEIVTTYTTDSAYQPVMPYEKVALVEKRDIKLMDVVDGKATLEELVAQMTPEQLAALNCGTGWGVSDESNPVVGDSSESVPGAAGETTHTLKDTFGIPSLIVADGPGGLRVKQEFEATDIRTGTKVPLHHYCTAWPVGFVLAQSFDVNVLRSVGEGFAEELDELGIAIVLGPGMNIIRDPLCGRNFEYFSEDPRLSGVLAAAVTQGIQSRPGVGACLKHYAANNQETNRNQVDTWIGQRALREIYLKGFEIAVKESQPMSIMTSYNLINGIPTADSYDLCTDIIRGEWGFKGLLMTDWNGGSSTPSKSMHAGNDLIMPGGYMRVLNILLALDTLSPEFDERGQVKMIKMIPFLPIHHAVWNSFALDKNGNDTVTVPLADGYTAKVQDNLIMVNDETIFTQANGFHALMMERENFKPFTTPATTDIADVSEDGKHITYRGILNKERTLCIGDVQRCAIRNVKVIMQSIAMRTLCPNVKLDCWK